VTRSTAGPWFRFAALRAGRVAVGVVFLLVVSFLMIHLIPGDPVRASLGANAEPQLVKQRRAELDLDRPLPEQFVDYVSGVVHLDFGESIKTGEPVSDVIKARFPATAKLAGVAILFVVLLGVPLGLLLGAFTSSGRRRRLELGFAVGTGIVTAIPEYLMGTLLVAIFALQLGLVPAAGMEDWTSYVLPALALALAPAAFLARVVRMETVNVLAREYMMTARSKQLPTFLLYRRHAIPNVLTASLTIVGVVFGALLGGSVVIETIFHWPGLGTELVTAILDKDYPVVQACVLVLGLMILLVSTIVDVLLILINPRLASLRET
jgi:peptide/nickel transport system permease protein